MSQLIVSTILQEQFRPYSWTINSDASIYKPMKIPFNISYSTCTAMWLHLQRNKFFKSTYVHLCLFHSKHIQYSTHFSGCLSCHTCPPTCMSPKQWLTNMCKTLPSFADGNNAYKCNLVPGNQIASVQPLWNTGILPYRKVTLNYGAFNPWRLK